MRLWLLFVLLAFLGCQTPPAQAPADPLNPAHTETMAETSTVTETTAATPGPSTQEAENAPVSSANGEIFIDRVDVRNPLVVTGRARSFENSVSLRTLDAQKKLITEVYVTSVGEMGHHNPYKAELWLTRDPGGRVTVEAFEYSAKDGSVRSLATKTMELNLDPIEINLQFATSDCTKLEAFKRRVPKTQAMARLLAEALVAGPLAEEKTRGATHPFPRGSAVRSVLLRDGVLTVDFNQELQNVGGACRAQAIRESVTRTLGTLQSVRKVVITAAGSESLALHP